jgi:hypothetical protein
MPLIALLGAAALVFADADDARLRFVLVSQERPCLVAWTGATVLGPPVPDPEVVALPIANGGNAWHAPGSPPPITMELVDWDGCGETAVLVEGNVPCQGGGWDTVQERASLGSRTDRDRNRLVNSSDFFDFVAAFFAGDGSADHNRDGAVTTLDFFGYLFCFLGA